MKLIVLLATIALLMSFPLPGYSDWLIESGKRDANIAIAMPEGPEEFPEGPHAFRIENGKLWVADSANGRILCYSDDNKLEKNIQIKWTESRKFIEDFALQIKEGKVASIWVAERYSHELVRVEPDGKELTRFKATSMAQLDQLAADSEGRVYVGDFGKSLIAVFNSAGKLEKTIPWELSGFAVDSKDCLHLLYFDESVGYTHQVNDSSGKIISSTPVGFAKMQNPRLWHVTSEENILVSFIPALGNPTGNILVKISSKGATLNKIEFANPYYINRYLAFDQNDCWLVNANYLLKDAKIKIRKLGSI
jgi:hypothetical protein